MSRVYTRTGDGGTTGQLYGGRIEKGGALVEALGDIDEAVSALGVARAGCGDERMSEILLRLQRELFVVAADLAVNPKHRDRLKPGISLVEPQLITDIEHLIDELTEERPLKPVFLVPGTTPLEAALDLARTVVRRAERHTLRAKDDGHVVSEPVRHYLNRLSDLVFILARRAADEAEEPASHE
ncbi:cob(I)alamin adenosyltransferase [Cryobacterium mesophilum]|uniref:cob(I)yrinic acid a,c-diamide adenosyltransferase n=1 Tax=Terrimesophilobacter mesophilus TaxID=433647 RepID=UPI0014257506|nr:cob(I)yrinic acid a,c-diamide adenosyltransferase [Terrimesophilobacter mesophilus]MBB5633495.1 cob(I)alamin adenosyltransferase [Terrimesophilobacter mesophilus]